MDFKTILFWISWSCLVNFSYCSSEVNDCFSTRKIIDLSYPYDTNTINWPGTEPFGFSRMQAGPTPPRNFWYASNDFKTAEHCGTHLDAPFHFKKGGWKVADIPVERLLTNGVFVDAASETNGNPEYKLPASKLIEWEQKNGPMPSNSVILVSFGWASRYGNKTLYLGPEQPKNLSFPGLSKAAAEWIVQTGKVVGVGVDSASVDQGTNVDVHIVLHGHSIYHLENVNISVPLPPTFQLIAMPMKIAQGSGAPCRLTALI